MIQTSEAITNVQDYVKSLYEELGISTPSQIDLDYIARQVGVEVVYCPCGSKAFTRTRVAQVDARVSLLEQREELAHEVAHVILHCGSQLYLPKLFIELQERQAHLLAAEFLAPLHMIKSVFETEPVPNDETMAAVAIAEVFQLTLVTSRVRLEKYKQLVWHEATAQYGRDYDNVMWIGNTELFFKNGELVGKLSHIE